MSNIIDANDLLLELQKVYPVIPMDVFKAINRCKSARKYGRWEQEASHLFERKCSNCGIWMDIVETGKYCKECGACMIGTSE